MICPRNLTLSAEATKTREARRVPLPADVVAELHAAAGPTWLWERAAAECQVHRPANKPGHAWGYSPSSWRHTVQNLFREFNKGRPAAGRLRPHDLRARAITLIAAATQSVDATAQAMGVDAQTARHYLDAKKASTVHQSCGRPRRRCGERPAPEGDCVAVVWRRRPGGNA